jgi:hypothetical protein
LQFIDDEVVPSTNPCQIFSLVPMPQSPI